MFLLEIFYKSRNELLNTIMRKKNTWLKQYQKKNSGVKTNQIENFLQD